MKKIIAIAMSFSLILSSVNFAFANSLKNTEENLATSDLSEMFPAREVGKELGYDVIWNASKKSISFEKDSLVYEARIGSKDYYINGKLVTLAEEARIVEGIAYIPSNFAELYLIGDYYILKSEEFFYDLLDENYEECREKFDSSITSTDIKEAWEQVVETTEGYVGKEDIGAFEKIHEEDTKFFAGSDETIGEYIQVIEFVEFETVSLQMTYYFDSNGKMYSFYANVYDFKQNNTEKLPEGLKEIDYKIGVANTQNAKLTKSVDGKSDTVVILVAGSGASDLNEEVYGNMPFRDIAWGLGSAGIDSFRFDKVTYSIAKGEMKLDNPLKFTVEEEYFRDVKEVTNMLKDMGYENIYLLGHSQGAMLAPRLYEDNEEIYDGLILLAGTPRTLTDIAVNQMENAINALAKEEKAEYITYFEEEKEKIKNLSNYTDEELYFLEIFNISAYYIKEMNDYDTGEIAKKIDKPILVLQGSKDFQVFEDSDFQLWKEVLKDNEHAQFILYDNLGHFFTIAPEEPTNTIIDYLPAQLVDSKVIEDITEFIKNN